MFDRRLIMHFDVVLVCTVVLLCGAGILNLYSLGSSEGSRISVFYYRQTMWFLLGLAGMLAAINIPYQRMVRHAYYIHGFFVLLVLLVLAGGSTKLGAQRWISIGGFSLQPSEFVKISFVLALAKFFSENLSQRPFGLRDIAPAALLLAVTFFPIYLQPDLGTAGILALIFFSFLFFLNLKKRSFLPSLAFCLCVLPFGWFFLKDYQKRRILVFLDPEKDPLKAGYQIIQSKIAVGSGGLFGKGFRMGTQSQLRFLPEQHSDFVFSVWAEEWGFFGCCVVLLLFFVLIYRSLSIAYGSKSFSGTFVVVGIAMLFFIQFFINICMTIGLFPVVGVPLPFFSYGGSALVSYMFGAGILLNIGMRRFT